MRRPRNVCTNAKNKNLYELSVSLIFSLWCLVFLFYTRFGHSQGNRDSHIPQGSNNHKNQMLLDNNCSSNGNDSLILGHNALDSGYSARENNSLEEVVKTFLGNYAILECELQPPMKEQKEQKKEASSHATYLGTDRVQNKMTQEKGRDVPSQQGNITHKRESGGLEYNYASAAKGAKVLAHNKEAKGARDILGKDKDKYLRNPCSADEKFVVIELSEETLVDTIEIANLEHYSSTFKDFELLGSLTYPTDTWTSLGKFVAGNVKHAQRFMLPEPKWVRYLKLNLFSHYGSEFYCTLSYLEVYGVDAIERMLEDMIVVSEEHAVDHSPHSNNVGLISSISEAGLNDKRDKIVDVHSGVDPLVQLTDDGDAKKLDTLSSKNEVSASNVPDPMKEVRQQLSGRIPGDTVLKILMQKVRSLELNLPVLEGYIKEVKQKYGNILPDLEKELSRNTLLLEKTTSEIKDIMEFKAAMEKGFSELLSWKFNVSSQLDELVSDNAVLRSTIKKVLSNQASLDNKDIAVLAVNFSFALVALLKLVLDQIMRLFRPCKPKKTFSTSSGWLLILVSSSMIAFITLLYD